MPAVHSKATRLCTHYYNVAVSEASTTCYHVHASATEIEIVDLPALLNVALNEHFAV
jgi:hypothetical protein